MAAGACRLESGRLVLEPLTVAHAAEMVDVLSEPSLYSFTGGEPPTLAELERRYTRQASGPAGDEEVWHNWVIRSDGRAVGFVQATLVATGDGWTADLAWVVGARDQGRGLAKDAATTVVRHLAMAGVKTFTAHIDDAHRASQAVATRLGLVATPTLDDEGERLWRLEDRDA